MYVKNSLKEIMTGSLSSALQFFACLLIIFGAEIAAGVFGFINKEQVQHSSIKDCDLNPILVM